jgi:hypothetical protein
MMLGKMEFSLSIQVALETRGGVLAGIDYEIGSTRARGDMFAARAVAGFAAILAGHLPVFQPQSRVWTGRKNARDSAVAIGAGFVAHKRCAFDFWRHDYRAARGGAGIQQQRNCSRAQGQGRHGKPRQHFDHGNGL